MTRTAIYRHFDADGTLLYVGITDGLSRRGKQHAKGAAWVGDVSTSTAQWFPDRDAALLAEADAIRADRPLHNRIHAVNGRDDVREFVAKVGRSNLAKAGHISNQSISRAITENQMPPSWYIVATELATRQGVDVPTGLFRWAKPRFKAEAQ